MSDILSDPDFRTRFTVTRSTGVFALGGFQSTPQTLSLTGVVNSSSGKDLQQVEAGDRVTGLMTFYSTEPLYVTRSGTAPGVSDTITWNGDVYRLAKVWDRSPNGYFKAIGVRTAGN